VNALGTQITDLLAQVHSIALTTCATITIQPGTVGGHHCPRQVSKQRKQVIAAKKEASAKLRSMLATQKPEMPEKLTAPMPRVTVAERPERHPEEPPQTTRRAAYTTLKHRLSAIDEEHPRIWARQDANKPRSWLTSVRK
jgi:hypothetical protein